MIFAGNPPTPATLLTDPHVAREQLIVVHTPLPLEFLPRRAAHGGECWGVFRHTSCGSYRMTQPALTRGHTLTKGCRYCAPASRLPPRPSLAFVPTLVLTAERAGGFVSCFARGLGAASDTAGGEACIRMAHVARTVKRERMPAILYHQCASKSKRGRKLYGALDRNFHGKSRDTTRRKCRGRLHYLGRTRCFRLWCLCSS